MVQVSVITIVATLLSASGALALPTPGNEAAVVSRTAQPKTYGGVFLNRYEETVEKEKREAEPEAAAKAIYSGVFLNRYEERKEKEKRAAKAEAEAAAEAGAKRTYGGVFLNRYEESAVKE